MIHERRKKEVIEGHHAYRTVLWLKTPFVILSYSVRISHMYIMEYDHIHPFLGTFPNPPLIFLSSFFFPFFLLNNKALNLASAAHIYMGVGAMHIPVATPQRRILLPQQPPQLGVGPCKLLPFSCFLAVTRLAQSRTHSSCGYLHKATTLSSFPLPCSVD